MITFWRWLFLVFFLIIAPHTAMTAPVLNVNSQRLTVDVRGTIAIVKVPAGIRQVTLERIQTGTWQPLAVRHLTTSGVTRSVQFVVPDGTKVSQLRGTGYRSAKFPSRITSASRDFSRPGLSQDVVALDTPPPVAGAPEPAPVDDGDKTTVVESDIWKIVGNQLFFFNQYRGLQVFDLTNPAAPRRTGTVRLAASGEQFYVLDAAGTQLALLGRSNAADRAGAATIFVLKVDAGVPSVVTEVPLAGTVSDSRLIGTMLYVMATEYVETADNWQPVTRLYALDLSVPTAPVTRASVTVNGTGMALQAAGGHLLLTTDHYDDSSWRATSQLHLFDLAADGTPLERKTLALKGQVTDKFKLSVVGSAAVATSLVWQNERLETWIETFPLAGTTTAALAQLELVAARGEQLHATRYDGNRLYVVTFFNTDPLFVVDLTDPAAPQLSGALEIPGWSTYIEPLGDRLLTVGVEDGRVAVSLFNVADATAPTLLSRLALGEEGSWSWSEANYDEKAVGYFPDAGIVLVPFQNYTAAGTEIKAIQAIAVGRDALTTEALLVHDFEPRRGAVVGDYFVSISGQELQILNRTTGAVAAEIALAWTTDRVLAVGNYLLQLEDGGCNSGGLYWRGWSCGSTAATARITPTSDLDDLVATVELGAGRIVGSASRNQRLYVAQLVSADDTQPARLRTSIFDLTALPKLPLLTTVEHALADVSEWDLNLAAAQLLWINDSTLAWQVPTQQRWGWWDWGIAYGAKTAQRDVATETTSATLTALVCPLRNLNTTPVAGAVLRITTSESFRSAAPAMAQNGLLLFSVDTAEVSDELPEPVRPLVADAIWQPMTEETVHSWLQVVDFNYSNPVVRTPVSIPGTLIGVDQVDAQGAILITNSEEWVATSGLTKRSVQAVAYDGSSAYLLDQVAVTGALTASNGALVFVTMPTGVQALRYDALTGRLVKTDSWTLTAPPSSLAWVDNAVLVSDMGWLARATVDAAGQFATTTTYTTPTNIWFQLAPTVMTTDAIYLPAGAYGVVSCQAAGGSCQ